jgi:hypothetical protein
VASFFVCFEWGCPCMCAGAVVPRGGRALWSAGRETSLSFERQVSTFSFPLFPFSPFLFPGLPSFQAMQASLLAPRPLAVPASRRGSVVTRAAATPNEAPSRRAALAALAGGELIDGEKSQRKGRERAAGGARARLMPRCLVSHARNAALAWGSTGCPSPLRWAC